MEPIILTSTLLYLGYTNKFIVTEYGIVSGYVLPILLLPSFFTLAISQALLPTITKLYYRNNIKETKRKIHQAISFSMIIGIPSTICFILFPTFFLNLIYNTHEGSKYMIALAPFCLLQYIQAPLSFSLDAIGKSVDNMKATLYGTLIRIIFLFLLAFLNIGIWCLIISTSINICVVTLYDIKRIKKHLK